MEKALDQTINTLSVILVLITLRISTDLVITYIKNRKEGSVSLIGLFAAFISIGLWSLFVNVIFELPWYMEVWQIISLLLASFGAYYLLQDLK